MCYVNSSRLSLFHFRFFWRKKNATISGLAVRESSSLFSLMKRSEKKPKLMSPLVFFFKKQIYFFLQSLAVMKLAANHKFYNASLNTCLNQKISSVEFLRTFTEIFFFFFYLLKFFLFLTEWGNDKITQIQYDYVVNCTKQHLLNINKT